MSALKIICFFILFFALSCKKDRSDKASPLSGIELGSVDRRLAEASGLTASISNPGFFWAINDSGNPAEVFLIDQHAAIRLVCTLAHVTNRDWEDIAIDIGADGKNYLYVADIGDNNSQYEYKMIYRFEEPILSNDKEKTITFFDTFVFHMPDGKRDAETILIDPKNHDLFIISKREKTVGLYLAPNPLLKDTMTFKKVLSMPFHQIVSGSISSDGRRVLLKDYGKIYYWERLANESLEELLVKVPSEIPYHREPQGEAIAWSRNGTKFYTLSESSFGRNASLIMHVRNDIHVK